MREELTKAVRGIREKQNLREADEAAIKNGVVLRLLDILGWHPLDVSEVTPEYSVGGRRVDFALRVNESNKVFIEVKRPAEELEMHQEQLLNYSFAQGVKLAALTNGTTWWLYLPLNEGRWEQRRFYTLDLLAQDPEAVSQRFEEYLSREQVESGNAVRAAEDVYRSQSKKATLRGAIPRAWLGLLAGPDDFLIDLLIETTEKLCGLRPERTEVAEFLSDFSHRTAPTAPPPAAIALTERAHRAPIQRISVSPNAASFANKQITKFVLLGTTYNSRTWQELLLTVTGEMYRRHPRDFDKCLALRGSKRSYFSRSQQGLHLPRRIPNTSYYVDAKLNSNSIVRISKKVLKLFGYRDTDLRIWAE
ncbi:MAG: restriction endonuclease subunit R [Candidatus Hydrogenedentes bacterium]|nr:restriction endonuclease subunit R [Candidatus Hydrogenedentota bacterium]